MTRHFDGLVQDCSISIADALEILYSCTKPSTYCFTVSITPVDDLTPSEACASSVIILTQFEDFWAIFIQTSFFVSKGAIDNASPLLLVMAWHGMGDYLNRFDPVHISIVRHPAPVPQRLCFYRIENLTNMVHRYVFKNYLSPLWSTPYNINKCISIWFQIRSKIS